MRAVWSQFTAPHQHKFDTQVLGVDIQRYWRPTQFTYNPGTLAAKLEQVSEGDFVKVITSDHGVHGVYRHDGNGGLGILDWNPACLYDPTTKQMITAGARRKTKVVAFSDVTGRWREISQPRTDYLGTAHWYGNTAFDGSVAMLNRWIYDPETSGWVDFRSSTGFTFANTGSLVWWPEFGAEGGWFNANNGNFIVWDLAADEQVDLAPSEHDTHATAVRHPLTGKIIVCGGSATRKVVTMIDTDGTFSRVSDAPFDFDMAQMPLFFHPSQNCYLRLSTGDYLSSVLSYWPETDEWRNEGKYPGAKSWRYDTFAYVGEYELFLVHRTDGVFAYKPQVG